jgi:hypothetical protein
MKREDIHATVLIAIVCSLVAGATFGYVYSQSPITKNNYQINSPNYQCENATKLLTTTVMGDSMRPTLWPGKKTTITPYNSSRPLLEGNIVRTSDNITHRIKATYPDYYITKGDNNNEQDPKKWEYNETRYVICNTEL